MAMSLWDHERRLHDLEQALAATLRLLVTDDEARVALDASTRSLRARGQDGAAALLADPASRAYAR